MIPNGDNHERRDANELQCIAEHAAGQLRLPPQRALFSGVLLSHCSVSLAGSCVVDYHQWPSIRGFC